MMANRTMDMVSPNRAPQGPQYPHLVREGPLYNLTFDEVQSQLGNTGKPLHNMNLDELLKNVISAESGQLVRYQNPSASSSSDSFLLGNIGLNGTTFSNKTINEVSREIVHQERVNRSVENNNNNNNNHHHHHLQQPSLGEVKLEEFFVRAAEVINIGNQDNNVNVVADAQPMMAIDPMVMVSQQEDWLPLQMQMQMQMPMPAINVHQQEQQQQQIIGLCPDFSVSSKSVYEEIGYTENPMAISMPVAAAAMSSTCSDSKGGKKRRYSDEMLEKTIERRQKRMAKNRESAAKSRAKKQAYINKLEADKKSLLQTNCWLKKLKEVEAQLLSETSLTPKYQLRRTSSTTF